MPLALNEVSVFAREGATFLPTLLFTRLKSTASLLLPLVLAPLRPMLLPPHTHFAQPGSCPRAKCGVQGSHGAPRE